MCCCKCVDCSFCGEAFCTEMNCFILYLFVSCLTFIIPYLVVSDIAVYMLSVCMCSCIELQAFSLNTELSSGFYIPPTFSGIEFNHSLQTNNLEVGTRLQQFRLLTNLVAEHEALNGQFVCTLIKTVNISLCPGSSNE